MSAKPNFSLEDVLPKERFLSVHPRLLAIMGVLEAAFVHEVRWRAEEDESDERGLDGWVKRSPKQWLKAIPVTPKMLRVAIEGCVSAGWVLAEKQGGFSDQTRSFKINAPAIAQALANCPVGQMHSPRRPRGPIREAPEGKSSSTEERSEEQTAATAKAAAQIVAHQWWDHVKATTGKDPATPPYAGMLKLVEPILRAGWTVEETWASLRALVDRGGVLSKATIERGCREIQAASPVPPQRESERRFEAYVHPVDCSGDCGGTGWISEPGRPLTACAGSTPLTVLADREEPPSIAKPSTEVAQALFDAAVAEGRASLAVGS